MNKPAFLLLSALLLCAAPPGFADPFKVRSVAVEVTGVSSVDGQRAAQSEAKTKAANQLVRRLTLAEDRSAAGGLVIDAATALRLAAGVDTEDEKRSATSYRAVVTVNFDPRAVRSYLDARNVPFVESQAAKAMIVPVSGPGVSVQSWGAAWSGAVDAEALTPYAASQESWDRSPAWESLQAEARTLGALRAVLAEAYLERGQIYVKLTDRRFAEPDVTLAIAGPFADLTSARNGVVAEMETAWKRSSIIRSVGSTGMSLVARFSTLADWVRIHRGLEGSRIISALQVEALTTRGADVSFVYAGRPDQLAADLRAKGLYLRAGETGWTLEASAGQ
ncbi:DUF2066 domain-containing protein [bacterium]|nr:DUF2066 domain-containing protein [bacterium]